MNILEIHVDDFGAWHELTLDRLGKIDEVIVSDGFFRAELAEEIAATDVFQQHYSLAVPAGTYNVRASGGALPEDYIVADVTIGSENVKVDFETTTAIVDNGMDFGDAPSPSYPTMLASDGARHWPGAHNRRVAGASTTAPPATGYRTVRLLRRRR